MNPKQEPSSSPLQDKEFQSLRKLLDEEWDRAGVRCPIHFTIWRDTNTPYGYEASGTGLYYRPGREGKFKGQNTKAKKYKGPKSQNGEALNETFIRF